MADDGKLYIIISDKREGAEISSSFSVQSADVQTGNNLKKESNQKYSTHRFYNFMESQAKQAVMYSLHNIGNFTGDYITQRRVNESLQAVNIISNIAIAGISAGPVGAAIAAGSTLITAGFNELTNVINYTKISHNIDVLRKRSGLNIYEDGSRGTEN